MANDHYWDSNSIFTSGHAATSSWGTFRIPSAESLRTFGPGERWKWKDTARWARQMLTHGPSVHTTSSETSWGSSFYICMWPTCRSLSHPDVESSSMSGSTFLMLSLRWVSVWVLEQTSWCNLGPSWAHIGSMWSNCSATYFWPVPSLKTYATARTSPKVYLCLPWVSVSCMTCPFF